MIKNYLTIKYDSVLICFIYHSRLILLVIEVYAKKDSI